MMLFQLLHLFIDILVEVHKNIINTGILIGIEDVKCDKYRAVWFIK